MKNEKGHSCDPKEIAGKTKPKVSAIPPSAILYLGAAMETGAKKYGLFNWRSRQINALVYFDAAMRHLLEWRDGTHIDSDSSLSPLAHVMACCAIILDAELSGTLIDDRGAYRHVHNLVQELMLAKTRELENP